MNKIYHLVRLSEYDLKYIIEKQNHVADPYSRITIEKMFFKEFKQNSVEQYTSNLIGLSEKTH